MTQPLISYCLQQGPQTNFLPHLPMAGDLRKFTGHKYFLPAMKNRLILIKDKKKLFSQGQ